VDHIHYLVQRLMPVGCKSFGKVLWNAIANGCVIDVSAQKPPFHFAIVFVATNRISKDSTDKDAEAVQFTNMMRKAFVILWWPNAHQAIDQIPQTSRVRRARQLNGAQVAPTKRHFFTSIFWYLVHAESHNILS
jgi:hypothetical protein